MCIRDRARAREWFGGKAGSRKWGRLGQGNRISYQGGFRFWSRRKHSAMAYPSILIDVVTLVEDIQTFARLLSYNWCVWWGVDDGGQCMATGV